METLWEERNKPLRMERRYEFENYTQLRDFLDSAAEISEKIDFFPNMGFGKDYVNITIYAEDEPDQISPKQRNFAECLDELSINKVAA